MRSRFLMPFFVCILLYVVPSQADELYDFMGHHLVTSYMGCDQKSLIDLEMLELVMEEAVKASGATILSSSKYIFPENGLTMVFLLSESHASIHTYPEHGACFIDLFTCGDTCDEKKFESVLLEYLQPSQINRKLLHRNSEIEVE